MHPNQPLHQVQILVDTSFEIENHINKRPAPDFHQTNIYSLTIHEESQKEVHWTHGNPKIFYIENDQKLIFMSNASTKTQGLKTNTWDIWDLGYIGLEEPIRSMLSNYILRKTSLTNSTPQVLPPSLSPTSSKQKQEF